MKEKVEVNLKEMVDNELKDFQPKEQTLLTIKKVTKPETQDEGVNVAEHYEYTTDGALPELAFAIAGFATLLPKNDAGEGTDELFIQLINEYYKKTKENKESE